MLRVRPSSHGCLGVLDREVAGRVPRAIEIARDRRNRAACLEHERRIDDVLRRRSPVNPAARVAAALDERTDQRHERMLGRRDALPQLAEVVAARIALRGDSLRGCRRNDTDLGLGLGEHPLDVEPRLNERPRLEDRSHLLGAVQVAEHLAIEGERHVSGSARSD